MKINKLSLQNFMTFESLDIDFSNNINVVFGENSTGKTSLIKLMYSLSKSIAIANSKGQKSTLTKDQFEETVVNKINGTFRCDNEVIGRLVGRKQGSNRTDIKMNFDLDQNIEIGFGNRKSNHIDINFNNSPDTIKKFTPVYLPPKEIISSTATFPALYDEYHIDFEETYYDLARLLLRPLTKGPNTSDQQKLLESIEGILGGKVIQRDNKFYLSMNETGEFEMGLVSEGYRKLSTLSYLIRSGSLDRNAVLFWDEPESNMNPRMIPNLVRFLMELSRMGVQIFVTTHSYFVQQEFNMYAKYPKNNPDKLELKFISLYRETENLKKLCCESGNTLADIEHNSIMDEFDNIYNREIRYDDENT